MKPSPGAKSWKWNKLPEHKVAPGAQPWTWNKLPKHPTAPGAKDNDDRGVVGRNVDASILSKQANRAAARDDLRNADD